MVGLMPLTLVVPGASPKEVFTWPVLELKQATFCLMPSGKYFPAGEKQNRREKG